MGFLFTEKNRDLERLGDVWIAGDKWGAYVLAGKSGSGKTAFLHHLDRKWQEMSEKKMITWMRVEELVAVFVKNEEVFPEIPTSVLILENMEELSGKDSTISLFWNRLETWLQNEQHLFIGVTSDESILIPHYVEMVYNQEIDITPRAVSYIADRENVHLSEERIAELCEEAECSVSRLIGLVRREKLLA